MDSLDDFLKASIVKDKSNITHTRIGCASSKIYGAKYNIPDEKLPLFYKLYNQKVFINNRPEYITEKQLNNGYSPLLVDFDFRYDTSITTRQHETGHIEDLITLYMDSIAKKFVFNENSHISVYVMHKPEVNINPDGKGITKDGIHMVFGISVDHMTQCMIRNDVLENIGNVLDDLLLKNTYDDVLDKGISQGNTNWQLFGSCKPNNQKYEVTHIYDYHFNTETNDFDIMNIRDENTDFPTKIELLKLTSARNSTNPKYEFTEEFKKQYNEYKEQNKKKKTKPYKNTSLKSTKGYYSIDLSTIKTIEDIEAETETYLASVGFESKVNETYKYMMCLPDHYADDFHTWIRIGWALHNLNPTSFILWMHFSSRSKKFNIDDMEGNFNVWNEMDDEGFTERSIMFWAKKENPTEFNKIHRETIDYYMKMSAKPKPTEYDIACVVYQLYKDEFRCVIDQKSTTWYQFKNHRWVESSSGSALRIRLSKEVARLYADKSSEIRTQLALTLDDEETNQNRDALDKIGSRYSIIASQLCATSSKNNIMKELADIFHNEDLEFEKALNKNVNLICFSNGVYDAEKKEFRDGLPEDYITISTKIPYIEYDHTNDKHVDIKEQIDDFFTKLFPDEELRDYMWRHLAACMFGYKKEEALHIYNGCGRNGKSKLIDLISKVLGEYACSLTAALITMKRSEAGKATPELAKLRYARYVFMSEPSKGDKINDGYIKELTGGDKLTARPMYRAPIEFVPQFYMTLSTNTLLEIKTNDDGTWRRMRLCDFESKFVEKPNPTEESPYEYLVDKDISNKFETWKSIMASILINIHNKTGGVVTMCDRVAAASNKYRNQQDYMAQFYNDRIEKGDKDSSIKKTIAFQEFKTWYIDNFDKNVPKARELYEFLEKKLGVYKTCWKGYRIKYDYDEEDEEQDNKLDCDI